MNEPWTLLALGGALMVLLGCVLACVVVLRAVRRTRAELARSRDEVATLTSRVEALLAEASAPPAPGTRAVDATPEYLITDVGVPRADDALPARIEGRLFADLVLRETVVRAASLTHGLRRALTPENRNRIRFEMRREVKRARKQRKADLKAARRDWEARQREEDAA